MFGINSLVLLLLQWQKCVNRFESVPKEFSRSLLFSFECSWYFDVVGLQNFVCNAWQEYLYNENVGVFQSKQISRFAKASE